jgi:hypothetical protein
MTTDNSFKGTDPRFKKTADFAMTSPCTTIRGLIIHKLSMISDSADLSSTEYPSSSSFSHDAT